MKVFIGWSGSTSQAVGIALRDWLPNVIQSIEPWMSEEDISKGARWNKDLEVELEQAKVGIVCLTSENLESPWILFESGALSKSVESNTFVCPYLFGVTPTNVKGPLAQFQLTKADKDDTRKLLHTINKVLGDQSLAE